MKWKKLTKHVALSVAFCIALMAIGGGALLGNAKIELKVMSVEGADSQVVIGKVLDEFEIENPNINVSVDYITWDKLGQKMLTGFAAGIIADVIESGADWTGPYARRQLWLELDDFFMAYEEKDDFYLDAVAACVYPVPPKELKTFKEMFTENRHLFSMPTWYDIRALVYRRDIFEEVGLNPDKTPANWEELRDFAIKLTVTDEQGKITRAGFDADMSTNISAYQRYQDFLWQNGGDWLNEREVTDPRDIKGTLDMPEAREALQFFYDLVHKYKVCPTGGIPEIIAGVPILLGGTVAMEIGSYPLYAIKKYTPELLGKVDLGIPPKGNPEATAITSACPNCWAISSISKHVPEAWKLVAFFASSENMERMDSVISIPPCRKTVTENAEYMQNPQMQMLMQIPGMGIGNPWPRELSYGQLQDMGQFIQAALLNQISVDEALEKCNKHINDILAER